MSLDLGQDKAELQKRLSAAKERALRVSSLMEHPGYKDLRDLLESMVEQHIAMPDGADWPFRRAFLDGMNAGALEVLNWLGTMRKTADRVAKSEPFEDLV